MSKSYNVHSIAWIVNLIDEKKLQTWGCNRAVSAKRADAIAKAVARDLDFGPMPIVVAALPNGCNLIIDGQHRLAAARLLTADVAARVQLCICSVECKTEEDVKSLFVRVNSGTPVPTAYWCCFVGELMDGLLASITQRWPGIAIYEGNYVRPTFLAANLRNSVVITRDVCDALREAYLSGKISVDKTFQLLEVHNTSVRNLYDLSESSQSGKDKIVPAMLARSRRHGFFIGLNKEWYAHFAKALVEHWKSEAQK